MSQTIPWALREQARIRPTSTAYYTRSGDEWIAISWATLANEARAAARALVSLGVGPTDRVAIVAGNRREWLIAAHGLMWIGAVPVGLSPSAPAAELRSLLERTGVEIAIVEDVAQLAKVRDLPSLRRCILLDGESGKPDVLAWTQFLARGEGVADYVIDARFAALDPGEIATIIYTSGTSGPSKGAMLTHANLVWTASMYSTAGAIGADDTFLSYLPLSHIAEQNASIYLPSISGCAVFLCGPPQRFEAALREAQPTVFFGVPRIWEKFRERARARTTDRAVPSEMLRELGLARVRLAVSGAAPLDEEVKDFFTALGLPIFEGYGMTEACSPITQNLPGRSRHGTVGRAVPGVELAVANDGELLVRGPNVFKGYLNDAEATASALVDGWLQTGDIGTIDADGFVKITGRKKEIIVTAGGKNVAPANIERALCRIPLVGDALVVGDRRPYLVALLTLDEQASADFLKQHGSEDVQAHELPELRAALEAEVHRVNETFARAEGIKRFAILPRRLFVEGGELTTTLKMRRTVIARKYAELIDAIYRDLVVPPKVTDENASLGASRLQDQTNEHS
jgi:long-chain acyl-CoA synthetase